MADNRTNKIAGQARSRRQVQPIHPAADLRRMSEDFSESRFEVTLCFVLVTIESIRRRDQFIVLRGKERSQKIRIYGS